MTSSSPWTSAIFERPQVHRGWYTHILISKLQKVHVFLHRPIDVLQLFLLYKIWIRFVFLQVFNVLIFVFNMLIFVFNVLIFVFNVFIFVFNVFIFVSGLEVLRKVPVAGRALGRSGIKVGYLCLPRSNSTRTPTTCEHQLRKIDI